MRAERFSPGLSERNPVTHRTHRRQALWQILLPLWIGVIVFLILAVMVGFSTNAQASLWADISLIFLIVPVMAITLILLAVLGGLIFLQRWLLINLPVYTRKAQDLAFKLEHRVRSVANSAVRPILKVEGIRAGWRSLWR
jgi:hypothetical protein